MTTKDIEITKNLRIRVDEKRGLSPKDEKLHLRMSEPFGGHGEVDHLTKRDAVNLRRYLDTFIGDVEELLMPRGRALILNDIAGERERQEILKREGRFRRTAADPETSDMEGYAILGEEVGEAARALLERGKLSYDTHHADATLALRKELVQVAAVALAWIEKLDRESEVERHGHVGRRGPTRPSARAKKG